MLNHLRPALVLFALFTLLLGFVYPYAITGVSQALLSKQANGSLIEKDGKVIGSSLIGQNFTSDKYFHGRPSATSGPDPNDSSKSVPTPYNAANSIGSNWGATSKALNDRITAATAALQAENPGTPVPVDLVTASASGLDPHISPAAAAFQIPRVAKARSLAADKVRELVDQSTEGRFMGLFGEPAVNVLQLNLALDAVAPVAAVSEPAAPAAAAETTTPPPAAASSAAAPAAKP